MDNAALSSLPAGSEEDMLGMMQVEDEESDDDDDEEARRTLHDLASDRHITLLEKELKSEEKTQINLCDRAGRTALQCAVERQSFRAVELLLEHGADATITIPGSKNSLLHKAVRTGNIEIIRLLLEKLNKDDINRSGNGGNKPLHVAIVTRNNAVVVDLLDMGADLNATNDKKVTSLLVATEKAGVSIMNLLLAYEPPPHITSVKKLGLSTYVNVNHQDVDGQTTLMIAAAQGNNEQLKLLLEYDAKLVLCDKSGKSVLHKAVGKQETLEFLLKYREVMMLLDKRDNKGNTALHYAAQGYLDNVEYLLSIGARVHVKNKAGRTPLHLATKNGRLDIIKVLVEKVPEYTTAKGMTASLRERFLNAEDKKGMTAFHIAASADFLDIVRHLRGRGVYMTSTHDGHYPVHIASGSGAINVIKYLLEQDEQWLAWPDNDGNTLIHHAARKGHVKLVRYLLDLNSPIMENNKGNNCLDYAIKTGRQDVCMVIAEHDKWRECLRKIVKGQLATLFIQMPSVAERFLCNFKTLHTSPEGKLEETEYDFSYFEKDPTSGQRNPSPLQAMLQNGKSVDHEVVVKFLDMVWRKFGLLVYLTMLIFYMTCLGCICALVWLDGPLKKTKNGTLVDTRIDESDKGAFGLQSILALLLAICTGIEVLMLLIALISDPRTYFDIPVLMDWLKCICYALYLLPYFGVDMDENMERSIGAIAIFLGWICLILRLQCLPIFGIYVILIKNHVWTICKVCPIFMLPLFAFGFAFYTMLSAQLPFGGLIPAVLTSWVMMLGEMDYESRILESAEGLHFALVLLFIAFCIVSIVVMNLLVALAVGDMQEVMDSAAKERLLVQLELFIGLERHLFTRAWLFIIAKMKRVKKESMFPDKFIEPAEEKVNILTFMQAVVDTVIGDEDKEQGIGETGEGVMSSEDMEFVKSKLEAQGKQLDELENLLKSYMKQDSESIPGSKRTSVMST